MRNNAMHLLTKLQIAERLGTTPALAARLLSEQGVSPIDFGRGRGRGLRWYSAAVDAALLRLHEESQKPQPKKRPRLPMRTVGLVLGRNKKELYEELTKGGSLQ
jgi:hypothetical protein